MQTSVAARHLENARYLFLFNIVSCLNMMPCLRPFGFPSFSLAKGRRVCDFVGGLPIPGKLRIPFGKAKLTRDGQNSQKALGSGLSQRLIFGELDTWRSLLHHVYRSELGHWLVWIRGLS